MTPERLLAEFPRVADAPDAVPRLRRFVLDLAVHGRLVPQDPADEPASALLKQIAAEKARLVKAGELRRRDDLPVLTDADIPFPVPATWSWVRLGSIGTTQTGTTPPKARQDHYGTFILFIKPGDIYPGSVEYRNEGLSKQGVEESGRIAPCGSILMVYIGTIGKCQLVDRSCSFNQQINSLTPYRPILADYVLVACKSEFFQQAAWRASARTTIAILNKGNWEHLPITLPPLAEQHRIVAKVEELMALCDRLEAARGEWEATRDRLTAASLARLSTPDPDPDLFAIHARFALATLPTATTRPDQIKPLRQTILNLAVRGLLVPQDSNDKPSRMPVLREVSAASGLDEEVFEQSCNLIMLPSGWQIAPLAQLSEHIVDCPHTTPKWTEHGEICIRTNQLRAGSLDLSEPRYVSQETYLERIERLEPKADDILYSREGGILGIACRVPKGVRLCLGQRLMLIRAAKIVGPEFLEIVLNSPFITELAKARTTGGAAPRVNMSTVRAYPFPLPPLAEQRSIVAQVETLMTLCDRLEAALTTGATTKTRLLDALLAEALAPAAASAAEAAA